jgi:hypothetical protein
MSLLSEILFQEITVKFGTDAMEENDLIEIKTTY